MPRGSLTYPFSAVMGETSAKRALECLLTDDSLNGVLIKGPSGTAKSVLVRSLSGLTDMDIVDLPPGTGDEDVFGGIDFERAVTDGKTVLKGGILSRADGNILCIDNINLLESRTLNAVMECVSTGTVKLEREGISAEYPCRTKVIATMDPAERELPESIADRFDICVSTLSDEDPHRRGEIVIRELSFRENPAAFRSIFSEKDSEIRKQIECARSRISDIKITRRDIQDAVMICSKMNAVGHRGDIACVRTARALAALAGHDGIAADDIRDASVMCLLHRRRPKLPAKTGADAMAVKELSDLDEMDISGEEIAKLTKMSKETEEISDDEINDLIAEARDSADPEMTSDTVPDDGPDEDDTDDDMNADSTKVDVDVTTMILDEVQNDLANMDRIEAIHLDKVVGRIPRGAISGNRNGRASGYRIPESRTRDPNLSATFRAAAPYQKHRRPNGLSIVIEPQDVRENVRTKMSSCSFMFAVDVSGSLVNTGMLDESIKGVRAMLEDGYVRRDKVALLTFGQATVNLAVPFTRNVESVFDALERTPVGGSTPLGEALLTIDKYMTNYVRKNPGQRCYVIIITDGQPDRPVTVGYEPYAELKRIAMTIKIPNTEWVLIDNGNCHRKINYALRLSNYLGARYLVLDDLISRFNIEE